MLKDAKIHFFGILWFLFWRKKIAIAGLNSHFKPCHVGLPQVSESMSFQSHPSTDYYRSSCPHGGEEPAIPHAVGRHSKKRFFSLVVVSCQG